MQESKTSKDMVSQAIYTALHLGHCPKGILLPMSFAALAKPAGWSGWKSGLPGLRLPKTTHDTLPGARHGGVGDASNIAEQQLVEKLFKASFNKQPKVSAAGHPRSQHPPPPPAVYSLPLECPATRASCGAIASSGAAAQHGRSAGIPGRAGGSAARLSSDVEPGPPSAGSVLLFSNREKLNCSRLLLLASQQLHLFVQWCAFCNRKK